MKTCIKHPKYKGKREPKNECYGCLELYTMLRIPRVLPMPTKVIKSKKVYNRKKKIND
ncbi:hypothetical protein UFOVP53_157 [uncultured Caudovirales phage]|uniref:Uncharacterized protein n=1 Tax=uncultured Caudovirales phage TaxID=2100421 RepID=A0A6J5KSS6_9CAUD|nr:hypothetical protein UFOVP53_157 [uncultured Caudovirales phage]